VLNSRRGLRKYSGSEFRTEAKERAHTDRQETQGKTQFSSAKRETWNATYSTISEAVDLYLPFCKQSVASPFRTISVFSQNLDRYDPAVVLTTDFQN